jgi:archaellum component FlaF (FlaF/FlaG flagellin family)
MDALTRVIEWIEAGKQVGKRFQLEEDGNRYWVSVGVQKWQGSYKIYFDKIEESHMYDYDHYDTEEVTKVEYVGDIQAILSSKYSVNLTELVPQKGQKVFNPAFE